MNSSLDLDAKEIELQKQKEMIGQMRSTHAGGRKKEEQSNEESVKEEKENHEKPIYQKYISSLVASESNDNGIVNHDESDNASTLSMNGSSPETLPRNDIPDITQNGSADSSEAAGSPSSTPLNPETIDDISNADNNVDATKYDDNVIKDEGNDNNNLMNSNAPQRIISSVEVNEADDELSSNDGNSFDTVKHYPMGNKMLNDVEINYGSAAKALETLKKSQEDLKRKAQEEEYERLRAQQTYVLPTVLSYNNNTHTKKVESDSDSDAELFATDPACRQCEIVRKDPRMKTKVCTLM